MKKSSVLGAFSLGALLVSGYFVLESFKDTAPAGIQVRVPELSVQAKAGQTAFEKNCQTCHGLNASGTDQGPPLVHDIYNPGHHSDQSFFLAVRNGVRAHHWPFGNMPPLRHIQENTVQDIVLFVREIQKENGIIFKQHKM